MGAVVIGRELDTELERGERMKWVAALKERLRGALFGARLEAEAEEEMRFHMELEAAHRARAAGLDPGEARRQAALAFGGVDKHREQVRDARGLAWLSGLTLDVKLGGRMLVKYPGLTLAGGLALAIAFALAASWFEFLTDVTSPKLPLADGDRIVIVQSWDRAAAAAQPRSMHDFEQWREQVRTIAPFAAYSKASYGATTADGRFRTLRGGRMTTSGLEVAGVAPILGRLLLASDEAEGAPLVAVIGFGVWQELFDGDRAVIGRTIRLGNTPATVIGVMPEGFGFPVNHEIWVPLQDRVGATAQGEGPPIVMFGRLAPGMSLKQAQAELTALSQRAAAQDPAAAQLTPRVQRFTDVTGMTSAVHVVNIPFLLFLIVVCANVATLGFARTAARSGEIAVRSALGASRRRLVVQLAAEALVLTASAAAVGVLAASWGLKWGMTLFWEVQQTAPPFWFDNALSPLAYVYVAVLTLLAALIIGGLPALKATGRRLRHRLVQTGTGGAGMRFGAVSTAVIMVQVALCVAFLPYAILTGRQLMPDGAAESAFPAGEFLTLQVAADDDVLARSGRTEAQRDSIRAALYAQVKRRAADVPGVAAATMISRVPGFNHVTETLQLQSDTMSSIDARLLGIDEDFFRLMNARVVAGRGFTAADLRADDALLVVDADWARKHFEGRNPIGQRIRFANRSEAEAVRWHEIVGVVEGMESAIGPGTSVALFAPLRAGRHTAVLLYLRTTAPPATLGHEVEAAVTGVDLSLAVQDIKSLDEVWRPVQRSNVFFAAALNLVAFIIFAFALAGIYALMSFTVAQRAREIAIRSALGADSRRIILAIFSRAAAQIGLGILAGAAIIALVVARSPGGPELVAGVAALMLVAGMLGCVLPAARALRIQPTAALKAE